MGAFENFQAFLAMGGYAAYVWPAYALAAIGLIGTLVWSCRTLRSRERDFDLLRRRRGGG